MPGKRPDYQAERSIRRLMLQARHEEKQRKREEKSAQRKARAAETTAEQATKGTTRV
jgi:hypothetical protein